MRSKECPNRPLNGPLIPTAIVIVLLSASKPLAADSCAPPAPGVTWASPTSTITLNGINSGSSVNATAMSSASNAWNSSCSGYDNPSFQTSGSGDMTVAVRFYSGTDAANGISCGGRCGCTHLDTTNGAVNGATVHMFSHQANGASCLAAQKEVLTHELGHALGLGDSTCSGRIMGDVFGNIAGGDCEAADQNFLTDAEVSHDPNDPDGPCAV